VNRIEQAIGYLALWLAVAVAVYFAGLITGLFAYNSLGPIGCLFGLALWASAAFLPKEEKIVQPGRVDK
jgi:hypothetical protein